MLSRNIKLAGYCRDNVEVEWNTLEGITAWLAETQKPPQYFLAGLLFMGYYLQSSQLLLMLFPSLAYPKSFCCVQSCNSNNTSNRYKIASCRIPYNPPIVQRGTLSVAQVDAPAS